jgi:hypothetical protein
MQISHPRLTENFLRLQRWERADRVMFMRVRRVEIWFHDRAAKREFVRSVYLYSLTMKTFESKRFFSIFNGMVGSNAECYADEMLRKLGRQQCVIPR